MISFVISGFVMQGSSSHDCTKTDFRLQLLSKVLLKLRRYLWICLLLESFDGSGCICSMPCVPDQQKVLDRSNWLAGATLQVVVN
jgi:hypothetical protein